MPERRGDQCMWKVRLANDAGATTIEGRCHQQKSMVGPTKTRIWKVRSMHEEGALGKEGRRDE